MENAIKEKCPVKFDIGPIYNVDPAKRWAYEQAGDNGFTPVERELIFDIDMTDYDDVRYCCSGVDVCLDCWPFITAAIKVIDAALRDDFGFDHNLWVFSGLRGVHCWVCDRKARRLNNDQRGAIVDYFRVYKGNANSSGKVSLTGPALHPFLVRSYTDVLKDIFENKLLCSQNLFSKEERFKHILAMIPDQVASELEGKWQENRRSTSKEDLDVLRWGQLKDILLSGKQKVQRLRRCAEEIVFSYSYPRLDIKVTKHMNHLLKAPFCVHPKTGRLCVPIDPTCCENFDPTTVSTLSELVGELNMVSFKADGGDEWDKTSLLFLTVVINMVKFELRQVGDAQQLVVKDDADNKTILPIFRALTGKHALHLFLRISRWSRVLVGYSWRTRSPMHKVQPVDDLSFSTLGRRIISEEVK